MSGNDEHRGAGSHGVPALRLVFLGAVLAVEALVVSQQFDAGWLLEGRSGWARVAGRAEGLVSLATCVAAAILLFGSATPWRTAGVPWAAIATHRWGRFLAAQVAAFGLLLHLTGAVFAAQMEPGGEASDLWLIAWLACGMATIALWVAAMVPLALVAPMLHAGRHVLAGGSLLGLVAFGLARTTERWWQPLGSLTLRALAMVLHGFGAETVVEADRFVIGTPSFLVEILPECSGYQGIGLLWAFLAAYFWLFRRDLRFPRVLLLVPIGTGLVWMANVLRLAALIALGTWGATDVAVGGFHSNAGALLFCAVALGLVAVAHHTPLFSSTVAPAARSAGNATAVFLAPLLALVATGATTGAMTAGGFDRFYALRVLAVGIAIWAGRRSYGLLRGRWSWPAVAAGAAAYAAWIILVPPDPAAGAALRDALAAMPVAWRVLWIGFRVAGAVVTAPLAEELAFRGYLLRRLVAADFERVPVAPASWTALAISSILFGAMHAGILGGTVAGLLYGVVLRRRGALVDAVVAHATTNALLAVHVLAGGAWGFWA